jgi:hypothetical protein
MAAADVARYRTYGNWRRPTSAGIGGLGTIGTSVLLFGLVAVIVTTMRFGLVRGLLIGLAVAALLMALLVRDRHHRNGLQRSAARVGFWRSRAGGTNLYRAGPLGRAAWGRFQLPGLASGSRLSEWTDGQGRAFALLQMPTTGHFTVVIGAEPEGGSLVDSDQEDSWVAHWGQWLATLGTEPGLVAASVTIETAPDCGSRLRREVLSSIDPCGPLVARQMLAEVVTTYPVGSAATRAWVALTFSASVRQGGRRRSEADIGRDLSARLPALTRGLQLAGGGAARPVNAQDLCEMVRCAYDPAAAAAVEEARVNGQVIDLTWLDVGPAAAQADWDSYRHDGAWSVSWSMTSPPRGEVFSCILASLLAPHPDIDRPPASWRPTNATPASERPPTTVPPHDRSVSWAPPKPRPARRPPGPVWSISQCWSLPRSPMPPGCPTPGRPSMPSLLAPGCSCVRSTAPRTVHSRRPFHSVW